MQFLLMGLILAVSNYKTLRFYFWHDDFSSFYGSQVHQCIHGWPYQSFCTIFAWLVEIFGYTPFPYFLIGNILELASIITFYIFVNKILKNSKVVLLISGLLASSYVAAGIFLEAWDPFVSYSVLATFFLSLIFYADAIKNGLNLKLFVLATAIFLVSISLFNFRAATNFAPVVALIVIYANKINLKYRILSSLFIILLFYLVFFIIPVNLQGPLNKAIPQPDYISYLNLYKIKYFFQTISAFIFTDFFQIKFSTLVNAKQLEFIKIILGFVLSFGFVIYSFIHRQDKDLTKLRIFAMVWIVTMFAPYWLKNDFSLNTTHRYILWMYPGILLAWASLYRFRFWILLTLIFLLVNIVAVNSFYSDFLSKSIKRESFYHQLHAILPKVPEESILYFDFQPQTRLQADDYFRVGFTPSESAIGTEYGVDYNKLTLVTRSEDLERLLSKPDFSTTSFYSFYYSDGKLTNTTQATRSIISTLKSQELQSSLIYLNTNQNSFKVQDYKPIIPTKLKIQMTSSQLPFNPPYEVKCEKCTALEVNSKELQEIFSYLESQPDIKTLNASEFGENSDSRYIIDNSVITYWIGDRNLWYKGKRPYLDFSVPEGTDIDGLVIYSKSPSHIPTDFSVEIDGNKADLSTKKWLDGQKIIFNSTIKGSSHLRMTILKTDEGDVPVINELRLLPKGFKDIDLEKSDEVRDSMASYIITKADYQPFINFLASGVTACLEYKSQSYGTGQVKFKLYADSKPHNYQIRLPSLGIENPQLGISCLPYPVKTTLGTAKISL